jgi:transposase
LTRWRPRGPRRLLAATHDTVSQQVKLLTDHREDLVRIQTQLQSRLRWHLHHLDPELKAAPPAGWTGRLSWTAWPPGRLAAWLGRRPGRVVARIAAELVEDTNGLTTWAARLEPTAAIIDSLSR